MINPKKVLFIGFEDDFYSKQAYKFLIKCGFEVTVLWSSRNRKDKLPKKIENWCGDYLFHMKSYYILPQNLLNNVKDISINFHPSSPDYPGSGCLNWALYDEKDKTGITVHIINEKIDNGKIIKVYDVPIFKCDSLETLMSRVEIKQFEAFCDTVMNLKEMGTKKILKECKNVKWGNRTGKIKDIDNLELIDFKIKKQELERLIRATSIGKFGPKLILHGYEFKYNGEDKQ